MRNKTLVIARCLVEKVTCCPKNPPSHETMGKKLSTDFGPTASAGKNRLPPDPLWRQLLQACRPEENGVFCKRSLEATNSKKKKEHSFCRTGTFIENFDSQLLEDCVVPLPPDHGLRRRRGRQPQQEEKDPLARHGGSHHLLHETT